jgi:hypothetical protein
MTYGGDVDGSNTSSLEREYIQAIFPLTRLAPHRIRCATPAQFIPFDDPAFYSLCGHRQLGAELPPPSSR